MKKIRNVILSVVVIIAMFAVSTFTVFATANYAYSIGGDFHSGSDVISAANYWTLCGYNSFYTTNPTFSYVSSANRLNSDILYFSSHGSQNHIWLPNDIYLTNGYSYSSGNIIGIRDYSLTNTRLVIYDACLTASGNTNLCTQTINSGADAVLGWRVEIDINDAFKWQKRFQDYLARGYKVQLAISYADSFTDYQYNSDIKNHLIYGNQNQVIKRTAASTAMVLSESTIYAAEDAKRIKDIPEIVCDYNDINYELIEDTIAYYFDDFDALKYEKSITSNSKDNSSFVIDYTLKTGDFSTNSGYTLIFIDGKSSAIYDNTMSQVLDIKKSDYDVLESKDTKDQVELALVEATESVVAMNDGSTVNKQSWDLYYDIETNSKYIRVKTVYNYKNTDTVGVIITKYPVS